MHAPNGLLHNCILDLARRYLCNSNCAANNISQSLFDRSFLSAYFFFLLHLTNISTIVWFDKMQNIC